MAADMWGERTKALWRSNQVRALEFQASLTKAPHSMAISYRIGQLGVRHKSRRIKDQA